MGIMSASDILNNVILNEPPVMEHWWVAAAIIVAGIATVSSSSGKLAEYYENAPRHMPILIYEGLDIHYAGRMRDDESIPGSIYC